MFQNFQKVATLLRELKMKEFKYNKKQTEYIKRHNSKLDMWHKLGDAYINDEMLKRLLKKYK